MYSKSDDLMWIQKDKETIVHGILKLTPSQINKNDIRESLFRCWNCNLLLNYNRFNKNSFDDFIGEVLFNKFRCCENCRGYKGPDVIDINPNIPMGLSDGEIPLVGIPGKEYERTFFAIKPDGVQRKHIGNIITRFENKGYKLVAMKLLKPTLEIAQQHYIEHKDKSFYDRITTSLSSDSIIIMILQGKNVIKGTRYLMGTTNPDDSAPGTIRGDLSSTMDANICHGSDSIESAAREIKLWFTENDL
jgi:nucleoside-diphosphate kinase